MLNFFVLLALLSFAPSYALPNYVAVYDALDDTLYDTLYDDFYSALSEAVFLERYNGEPEKNKKNPGLFSLTATALEWNSLNFTMDMDYNPTNCQDEENGWTADTWEYALDPARALCPLPPRIDPKGEIFIAKRGKSIYSVRNGLAKRLGPTTFNDEDSISKVIAADIDFDGEPEFFLLLCFGSAGEFYLLVDSNGSDAPLKRLFAPYLGEVNVFDFFISKQNMIFDCPYFDKEKKSIRLGSGGINSFKSSEFTFKNGRYFLSLAGAAAKANDSTMVLKVLYELDTEGKAIRRFATTPGDDKAPHMLLLDNTNYFAQKDATQWNKPQRIALHQGNLRVYPDGVNEYEDLLAVPFKLGKKIGTVPANTWVQLEDIAWLGERAKMSGEEDYPEAKRIIHANQAMQDEDGAELELGMWCKVSFALASKKAGLSKQQKPQATGHKGTEHKDTGHNGWIPCSKILLNSSKLLTTRAEPSLLSTKDSEMNHFYISERKTNSEGEWLYLEVTQSGQRGWVLRSELEKKL